MSYVALPLATFLLLWLLALAALPFLVLRDRHLAVVRKRSLYDKNAGQIRLLTFWLQAILAVALVADELAGGVLIRQFSGPWQAVFLVLVVLSMVAAVFALLSLVLARRSAQAGQSWSWAGSLTGASGGLCSIGAACCGTLLIWVFLRGNSPALPGEASASDPQIIAMLTALWAGPERVPATVFGLVCLSLALTAAQATALCWHVLRRRADDFGRDYYMYAVRGRARRAACAGALSLPFSSVLLWLTPVFFMERLPTMMPVEPEAAFWVLSLGSLCLPLAVLCWYVLVRSDAPLRKKFLVFLAPPLLWIGVYCLLARLWV